MAQKDLEVGRQAARELLERVGQGWGARSVLVAWTKLDILARVALVATLAAVVIYTTGNLREYFDSTKTKLEFHKDRSGDVSARPTEWAAAGKAAELGRHYTDLYALANEYKDKAEMFGRVQITALSLLVLLFALAVIGEFRRFRAVDRMRAAVEHLRSPEGLEQLKSWEPPSRKP